MEVKNSYNIISILDTDKYSLKKSPIYITKLNRNSKKLEEALKIVNLSKSVLTKELKELSDSEYHKLKFANDLYLKKNVINLIYFDRCLCNKEKEYFKRIIRKLSKSYNIKFNIITKDVYFIIDLVDGFNLNGKFIDKDKIFDKSIYKYFNSCELIDFVNLSRKNGHLSDNFVTVNEVLKDIYRELR